MAKGDHLAIDRKRGLFEHHGIDVGDGTVVHFRKDTTGRKAIVDREPIEKFRKGGTERVVQHLQSDHPDIVIARALECHDLQRSNNLKSYHALNRNCEHLATWCKTGQVESRQAESVKGTGRAVAPILLRTAFRGILGAFTPIR